MTSTDSPLTGQQLDDIDTRQQAATAGPWCTDSWEIYQGTRYVPGISLWIGETCRGVSSPEQDRADAAFVAAARTDVPALLAEVRRLRAESASAIEQVEQAFAAELNDDRALILLDALIVLRSKLRCTCARSQGLHEKVCRRYVPGHELLSPVRRLAAARAELHPAAVPAAVVGGEPGTAL